MMKNFGKKIAIGALSLFLAGKEISAYTPKDISEIKTTFEVGGVQYFVLQDGNITSGKDDVAIISKDGKWTREGKIMPKAFLDEAGKAINMFNGKSKKGITLVDFFKYTNTKGVENCFNVWSDGSITLGPFGYNNETKWFYDTNGNGKRDKGEAYMSTGFDSLANSKIKQSIGELGPLMAERKRLQAENADYSNRIKNLTETISLYSNNSDPTKTKQYSELVSVLEKTKKDYEAKINGLDKKLSDANIKINGLEQALSDMNMPTQPATSEVQSNNQIATQPKMPMASADSSTTNVQTESPAQEYNGMKKGSDEDMSVLVKNFTIPPAKTYPDFKGFMFSAKGGLILNGNYLPSGYDGEVGLRYDFGRAGIGANLGGGMGSSEITDSYIGDVSPATGRHAEGKITLQELLRLTASLEARLELSKPQSEFAIGLLAEGGFVYIPTNEKTEEKIIGKSGNVLAQNSYSIPGSQIDYFGGVGFDFGKKGGVRFEALVGEESNKGAYAKLGMEIPISKN